MKIAIIAGSSLSILHFRKALILALMKHAEVGVFSPFEDQATTEAILKLGVNYTPTHFKSRGLNFISDLKAMLHLSRELVDFKPDYVLNYTIKAVIWGSFAARRANIHKIYPMITGLGYAFTNVSSIKRRMIHKLAIFLYRKSLRWSQTIFFQNPDDLSLFQKLKIIAANKQTIILNGSGVDIAYYSASPPSLAPMRFLMVARLLKDKGIIEYLKAAEGVKSLYPQVEFHLVGWIDDNPSAISKALLKKYIEKKIIIFHGKLSDVRPILALSSVFVLPSYREGTPRSVLEAMATGRAIITTDAPGCKETVIVEDNGYLVPVKSVTALVNAMVKFIENPQLVIKMGEASRVIAQAKYDVHQVNKIILAGIGL